MTQLPKFQLHPYPPAGETDANTQNAAVAAFPSGKHALICFIKADCPTCQVVAPLLQHLQNTSTADLDLYCIDQTQTPAQGFNQTHADLERLDDRSLHTAFAFDIDTVPTLFYADGSGTQLKTLVGFERQEWQTLLEELHGNALLESNPNWSEYPEWRPGCGSLSVDPLHYDRLRAEADNSPIRARRIEVAEQDDEFEFLFDQGFTDGLPVVPPTPERVLRMLGGTRRDPQEVLALMPPNMAPATVEKVAINAVMAGCKPEYLPVVIAAVEAVCTDEFNIHGVTATTMGASPVMIVNGPIRHQIGMNMGLSALGQGNRANATIGRAVRLAVRNIGGAKPGGTERQTLGTPMKFTMCFAEWEERSDWDPLHVERGFDKDQSVVTVLAMTGGPSLIVDQTSRAGDQIAGSFALTLESAHHPRAHNMGDCILVVCPEHLDTLKRDGYDKAKIRTKIQEVTAVPLRQLIADEVTGVGLDPAKAANMSDAALDRLMPKFASEDNIHIVVAGSDAGKFSAAFHGWASGPIGSMPVSKLIQQ